MTRSVRARWWNVAGVLALGVVTAAVFLLLDRTVAAVIAVLVCAGAAVVVAPMRPRVTTTHWEAQQRLVRDGVPIVYRRPGCPRCLRLRWYLGPVTRTLTWVDVWADAEGAAFARDVGAGKERLPIVILDDGEALVRPDPRVARERLCRRERRPSPEPDRHVTRRARP